MERSFEKPKMEVIKFEAEDIIVTSGGGCEGYCQLVGCSQIVYTTQC